MRISIHDSSASTGLAAAQAGAAIIRDAIAKKNSAHIVVATGTSQFEMLARLVAQPDIPWNLVTAFHLDEYVGLPVTHPASASLYMWQRFVSKLPYPLKAFHYINGTADRQAECERLGRIIQNHPIDVAFIGIGENGHLAFNDPSADFETREPYLVVDLDDACRQQQLNERWFEKLEEVPTQAISMSARQITRSRAIICTVSEKRKARAVQAALQGPISSDIPASILQRHDNYTVFLDSDAASLLDPT